MTSEAREDRIPLAAANAVITLAWYAMPDVVRSRPLRLVLKAGLLAGGLAAYRTWAREDLAQLAELRHELDANTWGIAAGAIGVGAVLAIFGEKAIYGFGERRLARGKRLAHTLPALGWASAAALTGLIDPEFDEVVADLEH